MRIRLILIAIVLVIAGLVYFTDFYTQLAPERLRETLIAAGPWGPIVIVVLFSVLSSFGTPGAIFLVAAATLWPFWLALLVNWLGATGAGMLGFAFARYVGRDWVQDRMSPRLRHWDRRLSENGLRAVILYRLMFFLNPASHWALGLSAVPGRTALLGTMIGFVPFTVLWTHFGARIFDWFYRLSAPIWLLLVLAVVVALAIRHDRRRRKDRDAPRMSTDVEASAGSTAVMEGSTE